MNEFHEETWRYIMSSDVEKRKMYAQFFTPRRIREELLNKLPRLVRPKVLDPACGTGEFLLSARNYFVEPELYCWEIDPELVKIAKKVVPEAKVELVDSLTKPFVEEFDVVIGNPPYYEFKPNWYIVDKFGEILNGRTNIYALFIYLGIRVLKRGGYLAYVVSSSMNSGEYFKKLRKYIVDTCDIVYLKKIPDPNVFSDQRYVVKHFFQYLVLKKDKNTGNYVFKRGDRIVFTENHVFLKKAFSNAKTLKQLGYRVFQGNISWDKYRNRLTNNSKEGVLLVWSHNIREGKLVIKHDYRKPQYIKWNVNEAYVGPAIVVKRIVGHPSRAKLEAALVPPNTFFLAENHVHVILPPPRASLSEMEEIVKYLNSHDVCRIVREITGNTQISKRELEELVPIKISRES